MGDIMDKLTKLAKCKKKISKRKASNMAKTVGDMQKTLNKLISEVNAMECKSVGEQINAIIARINAVENNLYDKGEIIPEAAALIYESEMSLSAMRADLKANQFIRREDLLKEMEKLEPELSLSISDILMVAAIGFLGGILGCAAWSYYG
jgi:hypothetical protein